MLAAAVFLALNGIVADFDEVAIVTMVYGLAAGEFSEGDFAEWLRVTAKD